MSKKTYEIIPVKKPIEKEALLNNISMYLYSRLENCQIESNVSDNTCILLVSPKPRKHKKIVTNLQYIVVEMIVHDDTCAVNIRCSKARPVFNVTLAAVMAPVALPVSGLLTGTAAIRLLFESGLKKELIKYISAYVS